jgi:invasion protein IalB
MKVENLPRFEPFGRSLAIGEWPMMVLHAVLSDNSFPTSPRKNLGLGGGYIGAFVAACVRRYRVIGCAYLAAFAMATFPAQAFAQGAVKSVHGDWQIRCETPPGAQGEQCALFQSVVAEDRPNLGITVLVLKTADQKSRLMRVKAPLGVLLPAGLGLKIDNADVGRAGFVRCLPNGCLAEVVMEEALVGKLRAGQTATFSIFLTPEEGIGFPIGMKGFGEGYDKLP